MLPPTAVTGRSDAAMVSAPAVFSMPGDDAILPGPGPATTEAGLDAARAAADLNSPLALSNPATVPSKSLARTSAFTAAPFWVARLMNLELSPSDRTDAQPPLPANVPSDF